MPLPGDLATITVTGSYPGGDGVARTGSVTFTPSTDLVDATGHAIIRAAPITCPLYGGTFTVVLLCTDSADISPSGWYWNVTETIDGAAARTYSVLIPHSGTSVDLSTLAPVSPGPAVSTLYGVLATGNTNTWHSSQIFDGPVDLEGGLTFGGVSITSPPNDSAKVLSGTGTWVTSGSGGGGITPPAGDIGGTMGSPTVVSTHLASPLPVAQGGTGQGTAQAALTALAGAQTAGRYLRSDGTNTALAAIQAGDVPTLNQSTTGTAAGLSTTLAIASGGTGQTSQQAAINALTGSQVAARYLRSDGTNATLSAIQAADVPTLNQNTTGTAAGLSATLGINRGGTGQVTQQAAINALTGTQSAGAYLRSDGTNATLATIQAGDIPTLNQNTTGTAAALSVTLAVASGGTGATTAIGARANLGEYVWDTPAARGLLEYNFPPQLATISNNLVSGSIYGVSFIAQGNSAVTKVGVGVLSSAATPTSGQNLIGLYSISGTTATQIAVTGDLGTWGSQGFGSYAFGAGQTLTAGATYLILMMSNATTPVHLAGLSTTAGFPPMYNAGLSNTAAPWFKVFLYGTAQTALPASFTISGTTMASTNSQFPWACLL